MLSPCKRRPAPSSLRKRTVVGRYVLTVERLEDRLAPAGYVVTPQLQVLRTDDVGGAGPAHQVVFLESSVADYQVLRQGVQAGTDVVVLNAGGDGAREMAAFLNGRHGLDAVHVVAHGAAGAVSLGTLTLDTATLPAEAVALASVGTALRPGGSLDLWSCNVAAGSTGQAFVQQLTAVTGANVAAASHAVGAADLGGGWALDAVAATPFRSASLASFHELLGWNLVAPMSTPRQEVTATLLNNGKVLVAGGYTPSGATATAEVYDPVANSWTPTDNPMSNPRYNATATRLANGKVLVAGGYDGSGWSNTADIYDPATNSWTPTANAMSVGRYFHTATLLGNGKVLVAGGFGGVGPLTSAEVYDPGTNAWSAAAPMSTMRSTHTATLLANGKVLVVGGFGSGDPLNSAELYDPTVNTWTTTGSLFSNHATHAAALLPNGKVLIAGGYNGSSPSSDAELYDPASGIWSVTAPLNTGRGLAQAIVLGNLVLIAGGDSGSVILASAEIYNAATNTWSPGRSMNVARSYQGFTVLSNGTAFEVGGYTPSGVTNTAEIYTAAPTITSVASTTFTAGNAGSFQVTATGFPAPTFSAAGLPAWASFNTSTGVLSGTPPNTTGAPFTITITASNGVNPNATQSFTLNVNPAITISPGSVAVATLNIVYSQTLTPSGGSGSGYTFALTSGGLPTGVSLSSGGVLSGTPTSPGSFTFVVTVTDGIGGTGSQAYDLEVKTNTTVALSTSGSPSKYGQNVTFTATVTPSGAGIGTPTGTVSFFDGATLLGSTGVASGTATFSTSSLALNGHNITAVYNGDVNYNASPTSNTVSQTVNQAATSVSLAGPGSATVYGQGATFTATVNVTAPGGGNPTGIVTFKDGATTIGTVGVAGGVAVFSTSTLAVSGHNITAIYGGDTNFSASLASNTVVQTVNQAGTTVTLVGSGSPTVFGQNVSFAATVNVTSPGAGNPTGTITFKDGATTLATVAVAGGSAGYSTTALSVGPHSITATYNGDTNFIASLASNTVSQTVNQDGVTLSLVSSGSPTTYGQPISFTVSVGAAAPGSGTPTGTVTLNDNGIPLVTLNLAGGTASYTTTALVVGAHNITATYNGDSNFSTGGPSAPVSQQVNMAGTTTGLLTSANPVTSGQAVTFSASVTVISPGAGTPTGSVTFFDNGTAIGSGTLSGGIASFTTAGLAVGSHVITAGYIGDPNFGASTSPALTEIVNAAAVATPPAAAPASPASPPAGAAAGAPPAVVRGILVTGTDAGGTGLVNVFDAPSHQLKYSLAPFGLYAGGVRVAVGDVNGDGVADVIVGAGPGGGPQVRVYNGKTAQPFGNSLGSFYGIFPANFAGGVFVAAGDVNGDGFADVIVSADAGGLQVNVFSGKDGSLLRSFMPREFGAFTGGLRVAAGDVNGDGFADIILGAGAGAAPQVTVYSGKDLAVLASNYPFPAGFAGGVYVAAGDVNGDGRADVICGAGAGGGPQVVVFDAVTRQQLESFYAFAPSFGGGVRVAAANLTNTGRTAILTGAGPSGGPQLQVFDSGSRAALANFFAYDLAAQHGLFLAGG